MTKMRVHLSTAFFFLFLQCAVCLSMDVQVNASEHEKVKLLVCTVGRIDKKLKQAVAQIQKDLGFSRQFAVTTDHTQSLKRTSDVRTWFDKGFPLVVFISRGKNKKKIEWRLYDAQNASMLAGKNYQKRGKDFGQWAHHIADAIWPVVTGQPGPFSTKIAYCKEVRSPGKKVLKHIYIADFDGSNERLLVDTSTVNIAPRWNRDPDNPLLFYSEHTNKNVRLVMVDMHGRRKVVANFDGINNFY